MDATKKVLTDIQKELQDEAYLLSEFKANREKFNIEFSRYKWDCRRKALDVAERTVSQSNAVEISDKITSEADKYYKWLIEIHALSI